MNKVNNPRQAFYICMLLLLSLAKDGKRDRSEHGTRSSAYSGAGNDGVSCCEKATTL